MSPPRWSFRRMVKTGCPALDTLANSHNKIQDTRHKLCTILPQVNKKGRISLNEVRTGILDVEDTPCLRQRFANWTDRRKTRKPSTMYAHEDHYGVDLGGFYALMDDLLPRV